MIKAQRTTKTLCPLIALCCAGAMFPANLTFAQDEPIKVKFEVDGKESNRPFKIFLSVKGSAIFEPPISDNSFVFPPELRNIEKVHLRLKSGKYDLDYGEVYLSKFDDEMVFGVDNAPFDEEHIADNPPKPGKELLLIYYLESVGTVLTTYVYK
jgi:hypothetical protein